MIGHTAHKTIQNVFLTLGKVHFFKKFIGFRIILRFVNFIWENIFHSRGTPAEICKEVSDEEIVGSYFKYVTKYVFFDEVLDWERDVRDYGKKRSVLKGQRRLI